ncbi:MAG: PhoX family protein [Halothiobacillaceae bacterium]
MKLDSMPLLRISALSLAVGLALVGCNDSDDDNNDTSTKTVKSVQFTDTPAPGIDSPEKMTTTYTESKAIVTYDDGSTEEFPLSYQTLFKNTDTMVGGSYATAQLFDVAGNPIMDPNGDPVIAETPDSNSLLNVDGNLWMVNHWEYDNILADGEKAYRVENWYSRMPMSMTLSNLEQDSNGMLKLAKQEAIDFSSVNGAWILCFGSQTPWNTHLGGEEDYDLYFIDPTTGGYGSRTAAGIKALTEVYFNNQKEANPYDYGWPLEVKVNADGSTTPVKHFGMGRGTWEMAIFMPDGRTAYFGDDGTNVALFMFVGNVANDPTQGGTLYAAKWNQTSSAAGGRANLEWVALGSATRDEIKAYIDSGIKFTDMFEISDEPFDGAKAVRAGQTSIEYLKLKPGMEKAAAFLEPRRMAAYKGATTEFNKMEGVAINDADKRLYVAMSYIDRGMLSDDTFPVDHIQVEKNNAGGTYEVDLRSGQVDTDGNPINSAYVGVEMYVPTMLLGEEITTDALGNTANPDRIANTDNVFFSEKMRTLFIGEDSGTHVNNFVWAYNVDTEELSRILVTASGAEATGLQVLDNLNGHAYVMSNAQHQGDWLRSMPDSVKQTLISHVEQRDGVNKYGTPNYYLEAPVGYIHGMPGM